MSGVIHVGAHKGEEVASYLKAGRFPIILFEPQIFEWKAKHGVMLVNVALSNFNGSMQMLIPHHLDDGSKLDTMSASGLMLNHENAIANGWTPTDFDLLVVPVVRFDDWAPMNYPPQSCKTLNIDVQGMELQVLEGFGKYLEEFNDLTIECSSPPLYEGGAPAEVVVDYLESKGFHAASPILRHGDIKFNRRR